MHPAPCTSYRLYLIDPELIFSDPRGYGTVQPKVKSANGLTVVTDAISARIITKIGGLEPMKWFVSLVSSSTLLVPFKVRVPQRSHGPDSV